MRRPRIGVVSCSKRLNDYPIQSVNESYLNAIKHYGGNAIIMSDPEAVDDYFNICDGFLLTGSHSNVDPERYGSQHGEAKLDLKRDALAFGVIKKSVEFDKPCLGICRGFQEMNVALGGTLEPNLIEKNLIGHAEPKDRDFNIKYGHQHALRFEEGSLLKKWLKEPSKRHLVNSLHYQGIKDLASGLTVEATADDGLIEAFRLKGLRFFYGAQWHPEWNASKDPISKVLFSHFTVAAKESISGRVKYW